MRAVRWKNYVYIRNAAPEWSNMLMANVHRRHAPWMDLLRAQEAGKLTAAQANVLLYPRPQEEFYDVKSDPHQVNNLAEQEPLNPGWSICAVFWTAGRRRRGDTVPDSKQRTPDRYDRKTGEPTGVPFNPPRLNWAGKKRRAEQINLPGPRN
jgi:hypothetical protein